jgi:hypothetical protein
MNRARIDLFWSTLATLTTDILNPLLVIALALYVSVGYLLTLLMPVTISHWQMLFWISLCLPLAGLLIRARRLWRRGAASRARFSWRLLLPFLPLLIFVPMFTLELSVPYLQFIHHADIHVAYVHQLLYGATPVDNIFGAGYPANYYWLYHAILAPIVQLTSLSPPLAASILNILVIISSILWIAQILIQFQIASRQTALLGCYAVLVYCSVNLSGPLSVAEQLLQGGEGPIFARQMVLAGGEPRLHSVMGKVMNFTSFPLALLTFVVALRVCARAALGAVTRMDAILASACICLALAVQTLAALYIVVALAGGMALTECIYWFGNAKRLAQYRACIHRILVELGHGFALAWLLVTIGFILLLTNYVFTLTTSYDAVMSVNLLNAGNVVMLCAALILLLPLFLLQTAFVVKGSRRDEAFIHISSILSFLLTASLVLPDGNQYKGVYFVAILVALSALLALRALRQSSAWFGSALAWAAIAALLALVAIKVVVMTRYYEDVARYRAYKYDGQHIRYVRLSDGGGLAEALYWIRESTPGDAVIVLPLDVDKYDHLIHERQVYLREAQYLFADIIKSYDKRIAQLERFYSDLAASDDDSQLLEEMAAELPGRALYAVVSDAVVSAELMAARGATKVFNNPNGGAHVFLLNPSQDS